MNTLPNISILSRSSKISKNICLLSTNGTSDGIGTASIGACHNKNKKLNYFQQIQRIALCKTYLEYLRKYTRKQVIQIGNNNNMSQKPNKCYNEN